MRFSRNDVRHAAPLTALTFTALLAALQPAAAEGLSDAMQPDTSYCDHPDISAAFEKFRNAPEQLPEGIKLYGSPGARFIITEYSDVECPWCRDYFPVPKEIADMSDGEIAVMWHHMPAPFHGETAVAEAVALECVFRQKGNRAFWVALNHLFETTRCNGDGSPDLINLPELFDLNPEEYSDCINSEAMRESVMKSFDEGIESGVTGTPTLSIHDRDTGERIMLGGARDPEELTDIITSMKRNAQAVTENEQ